MKKMKTLGWAILLAGLGVFGTAARAADSVAYADIVNETAPLLTGPELDSLKASLVGAYDGVVFVNADYLVNARQTGGVSFMNIGRTRNNDRRPPSKNILRYRLEVTPGMDVTDARIAEIAAHNTLLQTQLAALDEEVRQLTQRQRAATGDEKADLRKALGAKRAERGKHKQSSQASELIHDVFLDAQQAGIQRLFLGLMRADAVVGLKFTGDSDEIRNLQLLGEKLPLREPVLVFEGGFYRIGLNAKPKFKKVTPGEPRANAAALPILNATYHHWHARCAALRQHRAALPDANLVQHCATTRDQLLQWPGVIPRTPLLYGGEADLPVPTQAEQDLFLQPTGNGAQIADAWPALDYTRQTSCHSVEVDIDRVAARKFNNTLWSFEREPRYQSRQAMIGKNWDQATAQRYRASARMGAYIYLRDDGIIGINNVFDRRHRWTYADEGIVLKFFDGDLQLGMAPQWASARYSQELTSADDHLYTYRAAMISAYSGRVVTRYGLNVDYLNGLARRVPVPRPTQLCQDQQPGVPQAQPQRPASVTTPAPKPSAQVHPVTESPAAQPAAPAVEWETVGYWDYDGPDGQAIPAGLILREQPGQGLGKSWQRVIELKNHNQLRRRARTLWPVELNREQKRVCIDYPGYPSYSGYLDTPTDETDGVYLFGPCKQ